MGFKRGDGSNFNVATSVSSTDYILLGQGSATTIAAVQQLVDGMGLLSSASADSLFTTTAEVCTFLSAYATSSYVSTTYLTKGSADAFLTSASGESLFLTKASSSAFTKTAEVCGLIEAYGFSSANAISATYQTKASCAEFLTSASVSTFITGFGFITSASASSLASTVASVALSADAVRRTLVMTTAIGNLGAGEDDLMTLVIPANTFGPQHKTVKILGYGTGANNANAKTVRVYAGTSVLISNGNLATSADQTWMCEAYIIGTCANNQDYFGSFERNTGVGADAVARKTGVLTITDSALVSIRFTGEATTDNDIVQEGLIIQILN